MIWIFFMLSLLPTANEQKFEMLLLEKLLAKTPSSFLLEGDCDLVIKSESVKRGDSMKVQGKRICFYTEVEIFHYAITRYLKVAELKNEGRKTTYLVQWIELGTLDRLDEEIIVREKKISIRH